ncbi:F-box protein [Quillaja saponaria]|uniref:F-box protein n=1 Tax=Quillaja saponaria TaxID=32244 RepID=A0AAD7M1Q2_QUISA|nr:F-box protein [Quillaja saponaria]
MVLKVNKKKQQKLFAAGNKEHSRSKSWPDLPEQLVNLMGRQPTLRKNLNNGGVIKSWRVAPKQCNPNSTLPWLQLLDPDSASIDKNSSHTTGYWLINTSSPYKFPEYIGTSHPAFGFHRVKKWRMDSEKFEWIKQDCTVTEPRYSNQSGKQHVMQFTNAIGFRGKFYALSLQGTLAIIEDIDSSPQITALSTSRVVPSVSSRHFREYLLESDGEILLVFLISRKSSVNIVDHVEVYRLYLDRLTWSKMESLGDRTLFVGTYCCMPVLASKVGCRRNCLYFRQPTADGWWIYDMVTGSISSGWSNPNSSAKSLVWTESIEDHE